MHLWTSILECTDYSKSMYLITLLGLPYASLKSAKTYTSRRIWAKLPWRWATLQWWQWTAGRTFPAGRSLETRPAGTPAWTPRRARWRKRGLRCNSKSWWTGRGCKGTTASCSLLRESSTRPGPAISASRHEYRPPPQVGVWLAVSSPSHPVPLSAEASLTATYPCFCSEQQYHCRTHATTVINECCFCKNFSHSSHKLPKC